MNDVTLEGDFAKDFVFKVDERDKVSTKDSTPEENPKCESVLVYCINHFFNKQYFLRSEKKVGS